jgi:Dolichyl-phosphate-mannose-protein mannosyltransferase
VPLIQLAHLIFLRVLEFVPNPEFFVYPYLASAGWLPYRQLIDHHAPGLWLLPVNFATLGFTTPESFRILLLLAVLTQSVLVYFVAKKYFSQTTAVYTVAAYALWQPFFAGNNLWPDLFLPLFTLPAFYFCYRRRWLLTGFFLGLGIVFKQSLAPLFVFPLLSIARLPDKFRNLLDLSFGAALPWIPVLVYLSVRGLVPDFLYWAVVYNLTVYANQARILPALPNIVRLALPSVLMVYSWLALRRRHPMADAVFLWGMVSVTGGLVRFHLKYFQPAVPFLALSVGMLVNQLLVCRFCSGTKKLAADGVL